MSARTVHKTYEICWRFMVHELVRKQQLLFPPRGTPCCARRMSGLLLGSDSSVAEGELLDGCEPFGALLRKGVLLQSHDLHTLGETS